MDERTERLLRFLSDFKCATSDQLARLFFDGKLRTSQHGLLRLWERGEVRRFRRAGNPCGEYVYTLHLKHRRQSEHFLAIAQVYTDLCRLPGRVEFVPHAPVQYSVSGKRQQIIADALVTYHKPTGGGRLFFLEVERSELPRRYPKIRQYEDYLSSGAWKSEEWSRGGRVFPAIVVTSEKRILSTVKRSLSRAKTSAPWQLVEWGEVVGWVSK